MGVCYHLYSHELNYTVMNLITLSAGMLNLYKLVRVSGLNTGIVSA